MQADRPEDALRNGPELVFSLEARLAHGVAPHGREHHMSRRGEDNPLHENSGTEEQHVDGILHGGKADGRGSAVHDAVDGLPEICAAIDADPDSEQFQNFLDGRNEEEAEAKGAPQTPRTKGSLGEVFENRGGDRAQASPQKHATYVFKGPGSVGVFPIEIAQPG